MKSRVQGAPIENTRPPRQICLSTPSRLPASNPPVTPMAPRESQRELEGRPGNVGSGIATSSRAPAISTSRGASLEELAAPPLTRTPPRARPSSSPSCARAGVSATTRSSKKTLGSHAALAAVWA